MGRNSCQLKITCEDGELVASLGGELDHHGAVAVRTLIDTQIRENRPQRAVLELSELDFMDSSGLGLIMGRYALMKEIGGLLRVADPSPATEKIMKLAGMERIIKIERTTVGRVGTSQRAVEGAAGAKPKQAHIAVTSLTESEPKAMDEKRRVKKNAREV